MKHRKRIQQPWSLLLQLLSLLFLVIALAGPRLGSDDKGRDHVVILDTSAWMGARTGRTILMDEARAAARAYVKALPSRDRVMIVRADALATPVTAFESDRSVLEEAIRRSQPWASALNLSQALEFAERAQKLQAQHAGEIVYVGSARVPEDQAALSALPANFRMLPVEGTQENVGLRKVGLRRSATAADTWDIFVSLKNYGLKARDVGLELQFGGAPAGSRSFSLKPGEEQQAAFFNTLEQQLKATPGVSSATIADTLPFINSGGSASFHVEGRSPAPNDPGPHGNIRFVSPDYFSTLRIPVMSGRVFEPTDRATTEHVAVIDETLARAYWPGQNPVRRR